MKDKYLPIGSIVTINDTNKSVMIVGYYAIKYQNVVKMYDYVGISYPEGTLLEGTFAFNHTDITSVLFEGYKDDSFNVLNKNMLGQNEDKSIDAKKDDNFINVKFDANGVVQYDEFEDKSVEKLVELLNEDVKNPFEAQTTLEKVPDAVPVVEEQNNVSMVNPEARDDTQNIIDNLNAILEESKQDNAINSSQDAKNIEEVKIDIPTYKFTEDGIIFNE